MAASVKHEFVIVGGGTAGLTVASRLLRKLKDADVAIIEPSRKHYYQPLWTLVGAGVFPKEVTEREQADYIPRDSRWYTEAVEEFRPDENCVITREGRRIEYKFLVVAAGIQIDWDKVKGLKENIGRHGICSNYDYRYVQYTWECIKDFRSGNAVFTMPGTPVKCGGAPQKIMYLADDAFRKAGVRDQAHVIYGAAGGAIFSVAKYAQTLDQVVARKGIEVRPETKEAIFVRLDNNEQVTIPFAMIHVTPPMSAPDFIKRSPLADPAGWVDVDKHTLRHKKFANVFSLGDAANLPTSKTGAAIRKQAPVVVENLVAAHYGVSRESRYDGYTSCPLVTGYGKLVLAEFDYDLEPKETFPFDQSKERKSMYLLKAYGLPAMYWNGMLKGRV
jgi:sulfide:quinone oxidoreductase